MKEKEILLYKYLFKISVSQVSSLIGKLTEDYCIFNFVLQNQQKLFNIFIRKILYKYKNIKM